MNSGLGDTISTYIIARFEVWLSKFGSGLRTTMSTIHHCILWILNDRVNSGL